MSEMRGRTIHKLALIAARIAIKEALQAQGVKISYVTSTDIDLGVEHVLERNGEYYLKEAALFYDKFATPATKEPQS